ncbi:hypothetical protein H6G54_02625 [Anabaena cylindrica FACHB-243]|uniref:Uncharacterized protein n=1 Tax=Anabaena cylindrica (strain ATCC 27899 / PCC 7122) TaxID=272123 RepID=K9ZPY8_ANACC|nr:MULTISPECIES: hypothetical protein [Anabaena]AFZ61283.1 hypothetical protein Anacy_6005 [Anabaena cylindrica PCC 7122]MBD2416621.1 hypothetical protein [Anabaena cylindrica FACHB-243]MBY5284488.1 hypothetical protein [Anabaena sp. CCAP 1446/1C]MBY5306765.1 hypothetical protein [Anabaena sp. CCAP 1446/1C]MCM2410074.1 hypothetical protein [Anabaena sp. CCAP 1446/1C]
MKCTRCNSEDIYRKSKTDLTVWCNSCHHHWNVKQPAYPVQHFSLYKNKGLKGYHHIDVWLCPEDKTKYSFLLRYQNSLPYEFTNPDYPKSPFLKGKFDTPQEAINAGIEEIYKE